MPKLNRELLEFYINAHKNIWGHVYIEIGNGSKEDIFSLKYDACKKYDYSFQGYCALCELMSEIGCSCNICSIITDIPVKIYECLGGLYGEISKASPNNMLLRLMLANQILHCVDNWEENAKKGGLI